MKQQLLKLFLVQEIIKFGESLTKKSLFYKKQDFSLIQEKVLNSFKSNIYPLKSQIPKPTPEPRHNPIVFDTPKPTNTQTKKSKHKLSLLKLKEQK